MRTSGPSLRSVTEPLPKLGEVALGSGAGAPM